MYHGEGAIEAAEQRYNEVAKGDIPQNVKEIVVEEKTLGIIDMLVRAGFAGSNSQARQLVLGKGVKVNNEVVSDFRAVFEIEKEPVVSKGKNNFAKFKN